jgi:hypothetical protein
MKYVKTRRPLLYVFPMYESDCDAFFVSVFWLENVRSQRLAAQILFTVVSFRGGDVCVIFLAGFFNT